MTEKEKLANEYIGLTKKFFEDSENVVFIREITKDAFEVMMKGEASMVTYMTLEICKNLIAKTDMSVDFFCEQLKEKCKGKEKQKIIHEDYREGIREED